MTSRLDALRIAAIDPTRLARFWSEFLGWEQAADGTLRPADDTGFRLRFAMTDEPKAGQNRAHFDLTSRSLADQQDKVALALKLGARHVDVGQLPEEEHVVLADPEGNEFCVIEPGNKFLGDSRFIGALAGDGMPEIGYFWGAALDWPLIWDQDEETVIQSPHGGAKLTWGGPPLMPRTGRDQLTFDLVPDGDRQAELDRLLSLGATLTDGRLADPGGTEFHLLTPR